jgi:(1->4)-alpha-D-glucan 1-alpha-D-glucosylmutase
MSAPRATYRLQLRKAFGFREAAEVAPYLARLGVSHVYLSSIFRARPGSSHGYDITSHAELNPELGDEADYRAMLEAFDRESLGRILDVVPNHMGVWGADNPLWLDVLEWGSDSAYAGWFDIDWDAQHGKLLAPVLGAQYGEELRSGKLKLTFDPEGTFAVWAYGEQKLPISPLSYPQILGRESVEMDAIADLFLDLPNWRPHIAERARALKDQLASRVRDNDRARGAIEARVARINDDWRELDRLIDLQRWRVAFHRVAEDEINYRRFFNINDLAGLRMELEPVFAGAHARVFQMLRDGEIEGLRIDHVDGLYDPKSYLKSLREHIEAPFYLVVEKILAPHESLRGDWPVEGTTGYEFLNLGLGVLVDSAAEAAFDETYRVFADASEDFETVARLGKLRILENEMASELNALGRIAARLARQSPMTADLTRALLRRAIKEIIASFPVYRAYVDFDGAPDDADRRDIIWAIARARRADPEVHGSAFDFLQSVMLAETANPPTQEISRMAALRLAMRLQQFSGPVMAKGVEDTAFYRYNRFLALNEVGGAPDRFGLAPLLFHKANQARAERWPSAMLTTATHDTKRGEDVRARLAVISEMPEEWRRNVVAWSRLLRARRGDVEGKAPPDRADEYLLYQMLVGAWPVDMLETIRPEPLEAFLGRLHGAIEKSLREAKRRSSWAAPNAEYEAATQSFAREALLPESSGFLSSFLPFVQRVAQLGVQNSLAQTVMKLTSPGIPDIYQGCELWDFSLVDPDNRRPVDYALREQALAEISGALDNGRARAALFERLTRDWGDGRIKLATTALLLDMRRRDPELFAKGDYQPLTLEGERADWAFGYIRAFEGRRLAVLIARFPAQREAEPDWDAGVSLPEGVWRDAIRGTTMEAAPLWELLKRRPFALLTSKG